jgi:hypothetical protein
MRKIKERVKKHKEILVFIFLIIVVVMNANIVHFFSIISKYLKGDIFLTYEDFPNLGEWIQIVTTGFFSYILWSVSKENNIQNMYSVNMQEYTVLQNEVERLDKQMDKLLEYDRKIGECKADISYNFYKNTPKYEGHYTYPDLHIPTIMKLEIQDIFKEKEIDECLKKFIDTEYKKIEIIVEGDIDYSKVQIMLDLQNVIIEKLTRKLYYKKRELVEKQKRLLANKG